MNTVTYIVDPCFLTRAATGLRPVEKVCFATGLKLFGGSVVVLTQLIPVDFKSSRAGAEPDPVSVFKRQQELKALGLDIEAQLHTHPGWSIDATRPSRTDDDTARRWENGAPFIGAIFSEDGKYVRFFNHRQHSVVHVQGNAREIEPNVFELRTQSSGDEPAPREAVQSQDIEPQRPVEPDGPPGEDRVVQPEKGFWKQVVGSWLRRPWKQRAADSGENGIRRNRLL